MKKIISFVLVTLLLVSAVPTVLATNDYTQGTQVVYTATGSESYTITVPALLAPGSNGTVTLSGTWAENRTINVTAEPTVTLTNSIKANDKKVLNVHFDGISENGNNTGTQTFTESVSVDNITNALFGTWSGKFNYNVDIADASATLGCDTLYWDGNTEGLYGVELNPSTAIPHYVAYKISDITPTASDCENGVSLYLSNGENTFIDGDEISNYFTDDGAFQEGIMLIIPYDNYENMGLEKGTYFMLVTDESGSVWGSQLTINGYTGFPHSEHCGH